MIAYAKRFRSYGAYVRSCAAVPSSPRGRLSASFGSTSTSVCKPRRILIVDFRDEVYASLKRVLEDEGISVDRAAEAAEVRSKAAGSSRDIVLINEAMPDECGWLISSKLRISGVKRRVWLYTARNLYCLKEWKKFADVDHVFSYRGDLLRLIKQIRNQVSALHESEHSDEPARENACRSLIPSTVL